MKNKAEFMDFSKENTGDFEIEKLKLLYAKHLSENHKLCIANEFLEKTAKESQEKREKISKDEFLREKKEGLDLLKKLYKDAEQRNDQLLYKLYDLRDQRVRVRFHLKHKHEFKEFREKFFPDMISHLQTSEEIIDKIHKDSLDDNITEEELQKINEELESIKQENINQEVSKDVLEKLRKDVEDKEAEMCRIHTKTIEMEEQKRNFDEYATEREIEDLKKKLQALLEAKKKDINDDSSFKNPNDFPSLLDFLDRSKKKRKQLKDNKRQFPGSKNKSKRKRHKSSSSEHHRDLRQQSQSSSNRLPQVSPNRKSKSKCNQDNSNSTSSTINLREDASVPDKQSSNIQKVLPSRRNSQDHTAKILRSSSSHKLNEQSKKGKKKSNSQESEDESIEMTEAGEIPSKQIPLTKQNVVVHSERTRSSQQKSRKPKSKCGEDNSLKRTTSSTNLQKDIKRQNVENTNLSASLRRTPSYNKLSDQSNNRKKTPSKKLTENEGLIVLESGEIPLQRFPSKPLFPEEINNASGSNSDSSDNSVSSGENLSVDTVQVTNAYCLRSKRRASESLSNGKSSDRKKRLKSESGNESAKQKDIPLRSPTRSITSTGKHGGIIPNDKDDRNKRSENETRTVNAEQGDIPLSSPTKSMTSPEKQDGTPNNGKDYRKKKSKNEANETEKENTPQRSPINSVTSTEAQGGTAGSEQNNNDEMAELFFNGNVNKSFDDMFNSPIRDIGSDISAASSTSFLNNSFEEFMRNQNMEVGADDNGENLNKSFGDLFSNNSKDNEDDFFGGNNASFHSNEGTAEDFF